MNKGRVKKMFARNYNTCHKAFHITKSENVKQDMFNRISQIVLMYSELFELSISEAEDYLKSYNKEGNSE